MVALVSVTIAVLATVDRFVEREREWAHGGDQVAVTVEARLPEPDQVTGTAAALGWPHATDRVRGDPDRQSVVLRLRWSGPPRKGSYQVMVLDNRNSPPRALSPEGGSDAAGDTGFNWADAYEVLAARYDWLADTAAREESDGTESGAPHAGAIGTRAIGDGSLIAVFRLDPGALPLDDPSRLVVAFCHVDADGEVRWAKRVPVPPSY
ncbi:hypothetical protein D0Q02_07055 [Micromonospora craniellae]|uniref:Uncharacterized protein n=1 Tax=Micromonospora craniellae TaxID=2294034 RepID=A0A372G3H2_9ACTN|nr:hypothetical protein D0Q02_07055 [Micromonospora craniellae]